MSSSVPSVTRYRVTGALFLLLLAAIFGPMLFDGAGVSQVALGPMPEAKPATPVVAPERAFEGLERISEQAAQLRGALDDEQFEREDEATSDRAGRASAAAKPAAAASTERIAEPGPTATSTSQNAEAGRPHAAEPGIAPVTPATAVWAVQVASFSNRDNAIALRGKLRNQGFEAFLSDIKLRSKVLTRVAVGPYLSEADASRAVRTISDQFDLDVRIVSMVI